jgi:hypothetical protein
MHRNSGASPKLKVTNDQISSDLQDREETPKQILSVSTPPGCGV